MARQLMARQLIAPGLPETIAVHSFESPEETALALADAIADELASGIAARGRASLAVSGGKTPQRMFEALAGADIDWPMVSVTLVDERFVPSSDERSNARLVRNSLLRGRAHGARFLPYLTEGELGEAAAETSRRLAAFPLPFDAVILGMGTDGHTASFFPDGEGLDRALSPDTDAMVAGVRAAGAPEPRLTLTLSPILSARFLAIHIEGEAKEATLAAALQAGPVGEMPVRVVLRAGRPLDIYWTP